MRRLLEAAVAAFGAATLAALPCRGDGVAADARQVCVAPAGSAVKALDDDCATPEVGNQGLQLMQLAKALRPGALARERGEAPAAPSGGAPPLPGGGPGRPAAAAAAQQTPSLNDLAKAWWARVRLAGRRLGRAVVQSFEPAPAVPEQALVEAKFREMADAHRERLDQQALGALLRKGTPDMTVEVAEKEIGHLFRSVQKDQEGKVSFSDVVDILFSPAASRLSALQSATEAESQFSGDDLLTLLPAVAVVILLAGLIGAFFYQLVNEDLVAAAESDVVCDKAGDLSPKTSLGIKGSSGPQTVFNIVKNIVGEGMLSLPAGVAAGTGVIGSIVIATGFCALLGYTFSMMGRVCHATGATNHKACAEGAKAPVLAQTMAVTLMLKTAFTCLSYAIVIGESYSRILHFFNIGASRQAVLLAMTVGVLLPLCLQKDLSVLSYTSMIGIVGEFFVVAFMQVRYLDGTYEPDGKFYSKIDAEYRQDFGSGGVNYWGTSVTTFVLLGSLSTAYIAHYNAPKFYSQMRVRTTEQFNRVVTLAFIFSLAIYVWVMAVGYLTFGNSCDGLILNNYSTDDAGATAARVAIGFAVVFGFPLSFTALRDSTMSVFQLDASRTFYTVTLALLVPITAVGCVMNDLGLVNSLGGAIFGGLIILVFPGMLCYYSATQTKEGAEEFSQREAHGSWVLVALGAVLCVFGSTIVLIKKYNPDLLE